MRYTILEPAFTPTFDLRAYEFASTDEIYERLKPVREFSLEPDAATCIFNMFPDALAMPVPVKIGSDTSWMLGIIENGTRPRDVDAEIPFIRFVRAMPERDKERKLVGSHKHWTAALWRTPVATPTTSTASFTPVEVRATDLDHPAVVNAMFGHTEDGRSVVRCELNGIAVSFTFNDKQVQIVRGR